VNDCPSAILRRAAAALLLLALCCSGGGCIVFEPNKWRTVQTPFSGWSSPGGQMRIRSLVDAGNVLRSQFQSAIYSAGDNNTVTIVLLDGPAESPSQVVTLRLFWNPHAGRTPIDATATNATITYIIFTGSDGQDVGIFAGAGYVYPSDDVGESRLTASIWESTLRLSDKSGGFVDRLGPARLDGKIVALRDELAMPDTLHRIHVLVRERLGRARLVHDADWSPLAASPPITRPPVVHQP
jgi:hypothetical protein